MCIFTRVCVCVFMCIYVCVYVIILYSYLWLICVAKCDLFQTYLQKQKWTMDETLLLLRGILEMQGCRKDGCNLPRYQVFVAASHQTRLDTRSKARRPIKVGIKGRGRSGTSRDSNPACLCCSSAHLVRCEPDEASSFTNRNVGPGTYAS